MNDLPQSDAIPNQPPPVPPNPIPHPSSTIQPPTAPPGPQPPAPEAPPDGGALAPAPATLSAPQKRSRARHTRRPTGKVARLPREIRNLVNQSLRDGLAYPHIRAQLAALGYPGFSSNNISLWARGGYQQWLQQQLQFEATFSQPLLAAALLDRIRPDGRSDLDDLNEMTLASHLNQALQSFDLASLKSLLKDRPEQFFQLAKAATAHASARAHRQQVELERLKYQLDLRKIEEQNNLASGEGAQRVITAETIKEIQEAANLL